MELQEFGGELVDGALGVFEVGDVGERGDDAEDGAVGIELRNGIAKDPEDFGDTRDAPAHGGLADGAPGAEDGGNRAIEVGNLATVLVDGSKSELLSGAADNLVFGDIEHVERRLIREFQR